MTGDDREMYGANTRCCAAVAILRRLPPVVMDKAKSEGTFFNHPHQTGPGREAGARKNIVSSFTNRIERTLKHRRHSPCCYMSVSQAGVPGLAPPTRALPALQGHRHHHLHGTTIRRHPRARTGGRAVRVHRAQLRRRAVRLVLQHQRLGHVHRIHRQATIAAPSELDPLQRGCGQRRDGHERCGGEGQHRRDERDGRERVQQPTRRAALILGLRPRVTAPAHLRARRRRAVELHRHGGTLGAVTVVGAVLTLGGPRRAVVGRVPPPLQRAHDGLRARGGVHRAEVVGVEVRIKVRVVVQRGYDGEGAHPRLGYEHGAEHQRGRHVEHHLLPGVAEDAEAGAEGDARGSSEHHRPINHRSGALRLVEELVEEGAEAGAEPAAEHHRGLHGHGLVVRARFLSLFRVKGGGRGESPVLEGIRKK